MLLPPVKLNHDGLTYLLETNKSELFLTVELYLKNKTHKLEHQTVMSFDAIIGRLAWIEFYDNVDLSMVDKDLFHFIGPKEDDYARFLGHIYDKAIDIRANQPVFKSKVLEIVRDTHGVAKECLNILANKARRKNVEDMILDLLKKPASFDSSFYKREMLTVTLQKDIRLSSKIPKS